jgi:hypothetical protein
LVRRELAERIGNEWEAWRAFLATQGSLDDWVPSLTASDWVARYRALWLELQKAGKAPASTLSLTWAEEASKAAEQAGKGVQAAAGWLTGLVWAVAAAGGAVAVALLASKRRPRG